MRCYTTENRTLALLADESPEENLLLVISQGLRLGLGLGLGGQGVHLPPLLPSRVSALQIRGRSSVLEEGRQEAHYSQEHPWLPWSGP